jgi:hypothetical protein
MSGINDDLINFDEFPAMGVDQNEEDDLFGSDESGLEFENDNEFSEDDLFEEGKPTNIQNDLLSKLLESKGITDASKIQIEDENGELQEINFNELPIEEQLEILNEQESAPELEDSEIELINFLRENNVTLDDIIEHQRQQAVQDYINSQNQTYSVDELDNNELFVLDLQARFPDLSEEELEIELSKEQNNPDLFNKKMNKLREAYKEAETLEVSQAQAQTAAEEEEQYNQLVNTMVTLAQGTEELYDLELEDEDKEQVLQFILGKDVNGQSEFVKLLNDPQALFELAWFAVKGKEAFNTVHDYYKKELDSVRKAKGSNLTSRPPVVKKDSKKTKQGDDPYGLNEIFNK